MEAVARNDHVAQPSRSEVQAQIHYRLIERLSASERRYRALVEHLRDPVFQCDADGLLLFVNGAWTELLGRSDTESVGASVLDFVRAADVASLVRALSVAAHAAADQPVAGEVAVRGAAGQTIQVAYTLRGTQEGDIVGSFHNLTEQKEVEESLKRARDVAQEASQLKGSFLANMSHEIRTPLSAVLGFTELLAQENLSADERRDCLQRVARNGEHLMTLVDDILDFSKIESGRMVLAQESFEPCELVDDVVTPFAQQARAKGIDLTVRWAGARPPEPLLVSDPIRLRQILSNLVSNAVKFTAEGGVLLEVVTCPEESTVRFSVTDSGVGIEASKLETIFEPFRQADHATTRAFGGTGLGLAISRRLARLLGGEISVWSRPGVGSRFTLDLPLETAGLPAGDPERGARREAAATGAPAEGRRVLLVEDTRDLAKLMVRMLEGLGGNVDVAANGLEAVGMVQRAAKAGADYHAVLMDMQMPVMDGYTATEELRAAGYTGTVIALTAHAMRGDRAKCLEAGCDDYLPKPVRKADLAALLERYGPAEESEDVVPAGSRSP